MGPLRAAYQPRIHFNRRIDIRIPSTKWHQAEFRN
jgi:hypothetical protein